MALAKLKIESSTYREVNDGAHRTAASIVGIPSLVRNLGLWDVRPDPDPDPGDATAGEARTKRAEERKRAYCSYIEKLNAHIAGADHCTLAVESSQVPASDAATDSGAATLIRFHWHGMLATVRLEFHTEYVSLASIIDLSEKPAVACTDSPKVCPRRLAGRRIGKFKRLLETGSKGADNPHEAVSNYLQEGIWAEFEKQVIDAPLNDGSLLGETLGEVFLDSRGIVTGTHVFRKAVKAGTRNGSETPAAPERYELVEAFQHSGRRSRVRDDVENRAPGQLWVQRTIKRIWDFIESDRLAHYEYTVTGFLDGRVLFITALGPQPTAPEAPKPVGDGGGERRDPPIRYFLHAYADDEWQLGRLVDRINMLGTMRLAATMEIGGLRRADGLISGLDETMKSARLAIQREMEKEKPAQPAGSTHRTMKKARAQVRRDMNGGGKAGGKSAAELMGEIGTAYAEINKTVNRGSLAFRLERSQYYLEQFNEDCGALREQRIEGFQTYSEFVTRRMSSVFGYIQYLRTRMEHMDVQNSSLERQFSWLKVTSVTGGIGGLVGQMNSQSGEIEKIQEFGEVALIGALVPYYIATSLDHLLAPQGLIRDILWLAVLGLGSIAVIARILSKRGEKKVWRRLRLILALFVGYAIIVAAAYFYLPRSWPPGAGNDGGQAPGHAPQPREGGGR